MTISLISPTEFKELIDSKLPISIVDTRPAEEFNEGHIRGAVHLQWEEWCAKPPAGLSKELDEPGYWGRLFDADDATVSRRLSEFGFANEKPIVVYADGVKSKGREGRVAWMLLYYGAKDVRILNGGFRLWKMLGEQITQTDVDHSPVRKSEFVVSKDERRRVLIDGLKKLMANDPSLLLIDTRTPREYAGGEYRYMPRMGTLPDSKLVPFASVFNDDGTFVGGERLKKLVLENQEEQRNVVAFCEVGVRACTVALLMEIYAGTVVPVYDGSMMEWSADPLLPVASGAGDSNS